MQIDSYVSGASAPSQRTGPADDLGRCPVHRGQNVVSSANRPDHSSDARPTRRRSDELAREAVEFLITYHAERQPAANLRARVAEVVADLELTGTYRHTEAELQFGAELAWRQSVRCVGRARWRNLRVRDRRHVDTAAGIAMELVEHIRAANNGGHVRNTITVFAPDHPVAGPRALIWNDQLIRYAGHETESGILGDPAQADFTRTVMKLGWAAPAAPGRFDLLPWVVETWQEEARLFEVPRPIVVEVVLRHPQHPWLAGLDLRWHALPVISNMRLRIGGVDYSCAPFSGFYLGDEIATRNLGDVDRYNQLPAIAAGLGLDITDPASMWREHATLVLNQAVLHSFRAAGVSITDGYTESKKFVQFVTREEAAARQVHANWSWVNGHFGHSLGPAFHRSYDDTEPPTNYWLDPHRLAGPGLVARHIEAAVE